VSETVDLYDPEDPDGVVTGQAPRERVRRENLPHAATAVFVRRSSGEVFVHRRAETKDVWAGLHDCAAGGVMQAGETPQVSAARELAEELGVGPTPLTPLLHRWYHDDDSWYLSYIFTATWDGPVRFADGEVSDGWWETPEALYERLADPSWGFVPDTRALLELDVVREALGASSR
jgi:isopentenyldiphosphate isomerase